MLPATDQLNYGFDPNDVVSMDENTSAYTTLRASDTWGVLEVTDGALIVREQGKLSRVVVKSPKDAAGKTGEITGNGWKLTLAPGWSIAAGARPGDFTVVRGP